MSHDAEFFTTYSYLPVVICDHFEDRGNNCGMIHVVLLVHNRSHGSDNMFGVMLIFLSLCFLRSRDDI